FFEGTEVVGLETDGRRVIGARTTNETFYADHTVLAAGPWSGIAERWVPSPIPVRPVKGQRILLRKTGFLPKSPVHNFRGYVVPRVDGRVLVGATRHEGEFDQEITADAVARMIATAISSFPLLKDARLVEARAGVRPGSPDGVPIMGPVPGWEGLSMASGHDAVGVMLSAGTGRLMADYISTGDAGPLEPFSLARFGLEAAE
ncbi:MAG: NAD(P)/FAD-dependent oxidoreductase, partial [Dehalococcoidia bacterium]